MAFLKSITSRLRLCDNVIQAIVNHGPRVSAVMTEKFGSQLEEGQTVPDFQEVQQFFLGILQAARARVVAAEAEHVDELAGDGERRTLRQQAFDGLKSTILGHRDFFVGVFGADRAELLGLPAEVGRTPMELLRQGERYVQHLTAPEAELPPPIVGGVTVDLAELAAPVAPAVETLSSTMGEADREVKLAQVTQVDRDRAVDELEATLLWVARSLEAIYRLAGETELADRIRPATRRRGRPLAGEGEGAGPTDGEGEGPAGGEADADSPAPPEVVSTDA